MKKILLGALLSIFVANANAVDGYKNIKFGSSIKDVVNANVCSLKEFPDTNKVAGLTNYGCFDFQFGGKNTIAMAFFINGKFQRFAINIDDNYVSVLNGLIEKYGKPSSSDTPEKIKRADSTGEPVFVKFDNDTVVLRVQKNMSTGKESALLIYTSPKYDELLSKITKDSIIDDI
ncbi:MULTISPECIES: hypothetical protein [Providencia]|uniref:hypothetical protein n=1 Tax=Providencia TaxID=586 RepID=UPI00214F6BB2|nr:MULTISPECIES: hypothetical protein [Providencia]EIL1983334.1 hypothetical protein [Providencia rettgeri]EMA4644877.1 hypothetical protein [Providencia rettgeri]MBZ3683112.1 hypothetical protein [Providencia rettgeri]MCR4178926.1 hypothetical protein [Providencia vermicola]WOB99235.1 hypothetical protein P3L55_18530 [Providencia sp. PROV046]